MRFRVPMKMLAIAVALACIGWSATARRTAAQQRYYPVYPVSGNLACDVSAAGPGQYACQQPGMVRQPGMYEQPGEYPIGEGMAECCDPCKCGPRWSFTAEAFALQRTTTRSQTIFLTSTGRTELLNSKDMEFPMAFGPKVSVIRHGIFKSDYDIEVGYFQFDGFVSDTFVPGLSRMVTDVNQAFFSIDSTVRYTSQLYCGEVNVRWHWFDWLTVLSGFRMGELNERYYTYGTGTQVPSVSVDVHTFNHLYGYQLGAEAELYNRGGPLRINGLCKAGVFANYADQHIRRVATGFIDETLNAVNDRATFLGEVGLTATYALTKRLAFRASYEAIWLDSVALAPEQIDTSNFDAGLAKVNLDGSVFYHGGGLGLEYRY